MTEVVEEKNEEKKKAKKESAEEKENTNKWAKLDQHQINKISEKPEIEDFD